jgi:hypothetical protein
MIDIVVLLAAVALLCFVFYLSGRYGSRNRGAGTSLRRGPRSHTTRNGRPKKAYATRGEADAQARLLTKRDGAPMNVYQCDSCAKWHVGHVK